MGEEIFGDEFLAFGIGVDAIGLVERRDRADILEEERDEWDLKFLGERRIDGMELRGKFFPEIFGHHHTDEDDLDIRMEFLSGSDDLGQVFLCCSGWGSAESVVAAESDDQEIGRGLENPGEASEPTGSCVAGDAGIHNCAKDAGIVEQFFEECRIGFIRSEPITGRDTIAQDHNFWRICGKMVIRLCKWGESQEY